MIRIGAVPFTVIGVLADDPGPVSEDVTVYIPYSSALRRLDRNAPLTISLKPEHATELERVRLEALDVLESRRGRRKVEFTTESFQKLMEAARESTQTMTRLLAAIAGISLLVGGVGITNIMLVSVTERTREIGIRLAIGTRGGDILRQFLIEALILSVMGGAIGILLGTGTSYVLNRAYDMPTDVTLVSVVGAFLCSAGIGVFFGYYPARRAALLDPIEALRAE